MYGFFKTKTNPELRREFSPAYCGVCEGIYFFAGKRGRLLANYDAAAPLFFLSFVKNFNLKEQRCAYRLVNPIEILSPENPSLLFMGAVSLLYFHLNYLDKVSDKENLPFRLLYNFQKKGVEKAILYLKEKNFPIDKYLSFIQEQKKIEAKGGNFDDFSRVSRNSFVFVYKYLWNHTDWEKLGEIHGELVYLWDAILDYKKDIKKGKFTPLLNMSKEQITQKFFSLFETLEKTLHKLLSGIKPTRDPKILWSFLRFQKENKTKVLKKWKK